jgi:D-sedoheptulose 7-phosphate isomerase
MEEENIQKIFDESIDVILKSKILIPQIKQVSDIIFNAFLQGNKIITFGNGGSAADAQHLTAEFISRYKIERKSLPSISLTTDTSILTAIGNDYNFNNVFERQCESLVNRGDIIIAISTSGNSINVIKGVTKAKEKGAIIISLSGNEGGLLKEKSDFNLIVPSNDTPKIQEVHRIFLHLICEIIDQKFKK